MWVYTPPGYDLRRTTPYPLIPAFDGDEYRDPMPLPHVLDSLLATTGPNGGGHGSPRASFF